VIFVINVGEKVILLLNVMQTDILMVVVLIGIRVMLVVEKAIGQEA